MKHPCEIKFSDRKGEDHEGTRQYPWHGIGYGNMEKPIPETCTEAGRTLLELVQIDRAHHSDDRTDHEGKGEDDMAYQDEEPAPSKMREATVTNDKRKGCSKARDSERSDKEFFKETGKPILLFHHGIGCRDSKNKGAAEAGKADHDRPEDGIAVKFPDFSKPLERKTAFNAYNVIGRETCCDG